MCSTVKMTVTIPQGHYEALKGLKKETAVSLSDHLRLAVHAYLKEREETDGEG